MSHQFTPGDTVRIIAWVSPRRGQVVTVEQLGDDGSVWAGGQPWFAEELERIPEPDGAEDGTVGESDQAPTQPEPALTVGTSVLWTDPRTSNTDPAPGEVVQILPDPDAYPIVVRWSDGFLGRYARTELKAVAL